MSVLINVSDIDNLPKIRVSAIDFDGILGHERSYLNYCGGIPFDVGNKVVVQLWSSDDLTFSGLIVVRYVLAVTNRFALHSDDYSCRLLLSAFSK